MLKSRIHIIIIIALLFAGTGRLFSQTVASKQDEAKLIAVLKSGATHKEKADACRQLAIIATKDSIAPLAALLGDEKLSHMARYGLEPIADPGVDEVFRDALGKLKGRPLVGVIGSIGVRRDAKAVEPLTKMLQDSDAEVAQAAARALGDIGNQPATGALQRALRNVSDGNKLAFCEGLLRCAETLAAEGRRDMAVEAYDQLRKLDGPHQVRGGALRGAILARGNDGVALLREHLRSDDYILFSAACQTALEMPGAEVTEALTSEMSRLPADNQILVIQTLGKRGDAAASPALVAAAGSGPKSVRVAAIRALPEIGDASTIPGLAELAADTDREISQAAQESLASIPGREADAAVMAMLDSGQAGRRLIALELIGRRRMTRSVPALLKVAGDADPAVRQAALKRIGELGGPSELPELLDLLMSFNNSRDLDAAVRALSVVCVKHDNPQSYTKKVTGLIPRANTEQKGALLRVLSVIGGTEALQAVRAATNDNNTQVRTDAIRALTAWKTADASGDLLELAKTSPNPAQKTAALRGYINLVRDESLPTEKKFEMCKQASSLIQRDEENKLLLGVLALVPSPEALSMAMSHLDNRATSNEACFAAVAISEKIVQQKPGQVASAMKEVLKSTKNKDVTRRARAVLKKAN